MDMIVVRTLFQELNQDQADFIKYRNYYNGEQTFVYGTEKFKELFPAFEGLKDNWCQVVVDAVTEKMNMIGIALDAEEERDEGINPDAKAIWDVFRKNNIDEQQGELAEGVFVEGRAAVIVWPDEELGARIDWQPASLVRVRYSEEDYRKVVIAVKRWVTPSGEIRVNVYDDQEVRKYVEGRDQQLPDTTRTGITATIPTKAASMTLTPRFTEGEDWPLPHDFGEVPVVEFINKRGSELSDVIPLQDGINYMIVSAFIAGEFTALKQKVLFTHLKAPDGGWSNVPGRVWHVPPMIDPDGKVVHGELGEFQGSELSQYRQVIEMLLQHLALSSKTPVRMFFKSDRGGRGDAPSGESELIEDEPLLDKAQDRMTRIGNKWFQVAKLVAKVIGVETSLLGEMIWEDPRSKYRTALLDEALKYLELGLPIEWIIKKLALAPEDLAELQVMLAKKQEEDARAQQEEMAAMRAAAESASGDGSDEGEGPDTSPS